MAEDLSWVYPRRWDEEGPLQACLKDAEQAYSAVFENISSWALILKDYPEKSPRQLTG